MLLVLPLSFALRLARTDLGTASSVVPQSFREALSEAFGHGSYVLLVLGFFTCGFHVAFITTHLPPYLVDKGLDASWGGWVVAFIGLFNIVGSIAAGVLGERLPEALPPLRHLFLAHDRHHVVPADAAHAVRAR